MTTATALDIETFLAREALGLALEAYVVGAGSEAAVEAAGARLDRLQWSIQREAEVTATPSYYLRNAGR